MIKWHNLYNNSKATDEAMTYFVNFASFFVEKRSSKNIIASLLFIALSFTVYRKLVINSHL